MSESLKRATEFLAALGIAKVPHTEKNYLTHLVSVYNQMQAHGLDEELCLAGLFHSIYGTERFQGFKIAVDQRPQVEALIGPRAEHLAFWNCFMDRASFDRSLGQAGGPFRIRNRETGDEMILTRAEYDDLCRVHLFDWLEQVPRSKYGWGYRREAYRNMAERLGTATIAAYDAVFAQEAA
ncbi:MAG TPA: hypothetical protein VG713_13235 [Pirellulales bacterium]|jgi:hypothetical protein|nr:hypothetical protein [Pirellulales bacterium]